MDAEKEKYWKMNYDAESILVAGYKTCLDNVYKRLTLFYDKIGDDFIHEFVVVTLLCMKRDIEIAKGESNKYRGKNDA